MSESEATMSNESNISAEDSLSHAPMTVGEQLAARRKAMGLSVEQVATQLKLAARQIHALEANDYASLPGMASVRGFVRAYAKLLRIDGGALIELISADKNIEVGETKARRELSTPFAETRLPTMKPQSTSLKSLALLILVVIAAGILVAQLLGLHSWISASSLRKVFYGEDVRPSVPVAVPKEAVHAPSNPVPAASTEPQLGSSGAVVQTPVTSTAVTASTASTSATTALTMTTTTVVATTTTTVLVKNDNALVLRFRDESWIEVKRTDGAVLLSRLVKAGATETIDITKPVQLVVGKPTVVDATLRGAPLELKTAPGTTTARLSLK